MNQYEVRRRESLNGQDPEPMRAVQVTEGNAGEVAAWCGGDASTAARAERPDVQVLTVKVPNGGRAPAGGWVVRDGEEFFAYDHDEFMATFRPA